jgi:hypothetical protein
MRQLLSPVSQCCSLYHELSHCIQTNSHILRSIKLAKIGNNFAVYITKLLARFEREQWSKYLVIANFHPWSTYWILKPP